MKWVYEYSNKLKWDKNKFLVDRLEFFLKDKNTHNVHLILDWNKISIQLENEKLEIDDEILLNALKTHDVKHRFNKTELYIRKSFDDYFDKLTELIILSESGMVNKKNLKNFLGYWIKILNGSKKNKPNEVHDQIIKYMKYYEFDKLYNFINEPKNIYNYLKLYYLYLNKIKFITNGK